MWFTGFFGFYLALAGNVDANPAGPTAQHEVVAEQAIGAAVMPSQSLAPAPQPHLQPKKKPAAK